ncbi:hypothetical protein OL229_21980 [Neisseriaceae bacterium JH1-16]|nr:hypothetical protein [Neisseriaceae bacterium JH1-16]
MGKLGLVVGVLWAILLSACGGGGGGGGSSTGSSASTTSLNGSALVANGLSCSGGTCAMPGNAATSPAGTVLYVANASGSAQTVTLPASGVGNWQGVVSSIDNPGGGGAALATGGAFRTDGGGSAAEQRLQVLEQQLQSVSGVPAQAAAAGIQLRTAVYNKVYNVNDTDSWYDHANQVAVTATVLGKVPLTSDSSGPQLYVWADSSQSSKVTPAMVNFLTSNFTQYVAPIETQLISAPWGAISSRLNSGIFLPSSTADVHLVLASLNQPASINGLQGFVNTVNVYRKSYAATLNASSGCAGSSSCQAAVAAINNSNEALVTFLNLDTLIATSGGAWDSNAFGAKQTFFTLSHEYQHLLYAYNKVFSPSAAANTYPTTWENELSSQTIAYLVSAALYPDPKGGAREHPELVSGGEFEQFLAQPSCDLKSWGNGSNCYYPKAVVTGMLMLHQFGPGIFKQWATTPTVGEAALNAGLASVGGGNYSRVMQRLGATLAMTNTTSYPAGYGFPARSYTVAGITINLPVVQIPAQKLSLPSSGETYAQPLDFSRDVTLTLPAYSYLSIVKQP